MPVARHLPTLVLLVLSMRILLTFPVLFALLLLIAACDSSDTGETGLDTQPDLTCASAEATRIYVPPKATYLRTSERDNNLGAQASVPVRLADLGIQPGDQLRLERLGEFQYNSQHPDLVFFGMLAVFSSTSELLPFNERYRVPGAIVAGAAYAHETRRTHNDNLVTDIPEDFVLGMEPNGDPSVPFDEQIVVVVPEGAQYLFLSPEDDHFNDNIDQDQDFALCILQE
jgi:hypothetical protein